MVNLFTYGSLMCSDIMFKVADCQLDYCQAVLNNFFRSKMHGREYPGIVAQPETEVAGILYRNLTPDALTRLDAFEGKMYQRQQVEVMTKEQGLTMAMTYVIKPRYRDQLTDEEWDFSYFLAFGKKKFEKTYFGFLDSGSGG
jgi:gamma-glutamylcyclotransferase (GGCT)/AIG2-like uncharacterized protein YtfP